MLVHQLNRLRQTQIPTTTGVYPITITYPSSGNYPDNDLQEWYFYPSAPGNKITFTLNSINTEANYDWVRVTNFAVPYTVTQPILQSYSGTDTGTSVESSVGLRVRFTSDGPPSLTGFTFTISESTGDTPLTSLTYPTSGNYPSNDFKIWYFEDGTISFSAFVTEANYDFLRVYEVDNGNNTPTLIGTYSGSTIPSDISSTNRLLLYFTSDTGTDYSGFSLTFTPN